MATKKMRRLEQLTDTEIARLARETYTQMQVAVANLYGLPEVGMVHDSNFDQLDTVREEVESFTGYMDEIKFRQDVKAKEEEGKPSSGL